MVGWNKDNWFAREDIRFDFGKSSVHFSHLDYGAFSVWSGMLHNHHRCTKRFQMLHNIEDIRTSGYVQILRFSVVQRRVSKFVIYLLGYLRIFNCRNSLNLPLCYVLQVSHGNLHLYFSYDKLSVIIEYMMNMAVGYFQFVSKYHPHAIRSPANKVSMNFWNFWIEIIEMKWWKFYQMEKFYGLRGRYMTLHDFARTEQCS